MEESPLQPIQPTVQAPLLVNAQVMKDIATWAASEEAKGVSTAINQHCAEALQRDLVEADFREFETAVAAQHDAVALTEWQGKLENALGIPHDIMERGREIMAAQMRIIEKSMRLGLEPALGQLNPDAAELYRQLCKDIAAGIVKLGGNQFIPKFRVIRTNKSRSWKKNQKLGHHAERMAARWHTRHRRYKKWMRVAATCGVVVWGQLAIRPVCPAEMIKLSFNMMPDGPVDFL